MFTSVRFTRILTAVAMTASVAACNDLSSPKTKTTPTTTTPTPSPVVTTEAPKPTPAPAPAETPPTLAKETDKTPVTVDNDDDGPHPVDTLAAARKLLDDKQYDKALKLANIAVKRMPERSASWNTLGRVQLQMGKREEAIASFEKAVDLNPKNSYARNNLGLAYEQLDRLDDARVAYGNAVEMESDLARDSLDRLKGVKSVMRTAKVDTDGKDGTIPPTTVRE
jgi:Flp pilus assembly protein TadD